MVLTSLSPRKIKRGLFKYTFPSEFKQYNRSMINSRNFPVGLNNSNLSQENKNKIAYKKIKY